MTNTAGVISRLNSAVKKAITEVGLIHGKRLVLAVSGGADSLALLISLNCLRKEMGLHLHGAHLDHGLRANASEADARFVEATFRELKIDLTSERTNVRSFRETHNLSIEEAARNVRYAFLGRVASNVNADAIVLGHTADDQAETVLMNIIRGTGLTGLRGMKRSSQRFFMGSNLLLIRPLLDTTRADTLEYCRTWKIHPRHDQSNQSLDIARNHIRLEVLPLLEKHNPAIRNSLIRLSRMGSEGLAYIDSELDKIWDDTTHEESNSIAIAIDMFQRLPPALQSHLLRRSVATVKGDLNDIKQANVDDMARLIEGPAGRSLDLPGDLHFVVEYGEAKIYTSNSELCPLPPIIGETHLQVPGETSIHGWRITANITTLSQRNPTIDLPNTRGKTSPNPNTSYSFRAHLKTNLSNVELSTRSRKPGDRFQPLGMDKFKKLHDFMIDSKIPRSWRDRVPLVCSPKGIAWVVGWRIADWAEANDKEGSHIQLDFIPKIQR